MAKKKVSIPDDLREIWDKDYYELNGVQRTSLTEFFLNHLQKVQQGVIKKRLDAPFFMTQEEVLAKEEDIKLDVARAVEKEKKDQEEVQVREEGHLKWESRRILKMDEVEKLMIENLQLKLELIEKTIKELNNKKKDLTDAQIKYAQGMESKYKILLDDYAIDLVTGVMMRYNDAPNRALITEKK